VAKRAISAHGAAGPQDTTDTQKKRRRSGIKVYHAEHPRNRRRGNWRYCFGYGTGSRVV